MSKQIKFNPLAKLLIIVIVLVSIVFVNGCKTEAGLMRVNEPVKENVYNISGKLNIPTIMETELVGVYSSLRGVLTKLSDYSTFTVSANGVTNHVEKDGSFILKEVPLSDDLVVTATAGKITLMLRVTANDMLYNDLSAVTINWKTTIEAYLYQLALKNNNKNITPGDIRAREYKDDFNAIVETVGMVAQTENEALNTSVLETPAVLNKSKNLATRIIAREATLVNANEVLRNIFILKDENLFQSYISPDFTNEWDSSANWSSITEAFSEFYKRHEFVSLTWTVLESEYLENNTARIRTRVTATTIDTISEEKTGPKTWTFDAYWRLEGTFWKLYKNLPYKETDPMEPGASVIWGEIASVCDELKQALAVEDINVLQKYISTSFTNDFDSESSYADIIAQAQSNFNSMDVKISDYAIENVNIVSNDSSYVDVKCHGRVIAQNFVPILDIDSGIVSATIQWRKEGGSWKIYKNLPYKFKHK